LERETGIEPATNGLGSRYSTIELLPLDILSVSKAKPDIRGSPASCCCLGEGTDEWV
jgi:hypothetical protein